MAKKGVLENPYLRFLVYGDGGTGKTRLACTACLDERLAPVLYLNASGNPESVRDYEEVPDVIDMEKLKDFNLPFDFIAKGQQLTHPLIEMFGLRYGGDNPYKTLIIDQLTDVQNLSFDSVLGTEDLAPASFPRKREWEHYHKVLHQMNNFIKSYYSLPLHVVMVAWEKAIDKVANPDSPNVVPMLAGQTERTVVGFSLLVARMVATGSLSSNILKAVKQATGKTPEHNLAFFSNKYQFLAKNQYGGTLPPYLPDTDLTAIYDHILNV